MRPSGDEDEAVLAEGLATVPDDPSAFDDRGGGGRRRRWEKKRHYDISCRGIKEYYK